MDKAHRIAVLRTFYAIIGIAGVIAYLGLSIHFIMSKVALFFGVAMLSIPLFLMIVIVIYNIVLFEVKKEIKEKGKKKRVTIK